jgi:adenosylmethionine-8-amino-7-oxononanoate aminotransferase
MSAADAQPLDGKGPGTDHPYLFYQTGQQLPLVREARGIYMYDADGREYIDGCSGAMISNIGHAHPRVAAAIARQAESLFFAYRTQFENQPALDLAQRLVERSAPHLDRVFYVSGGSEAVESAMKICRQYFFATGRGSRHVFISRTPSYHGSTLGALALTSYAPLEIPFRPLIQTYPKIPAPYCYRCAYGATYPDCGLACAWELERTIQAQGPENVAAFVAEPIGGASTGAVVPPEDYFEVIGTICKRYGVFLILDEVMTAFGRTGPLFAYEHWDIPVDVVALSKGMGSGYFPLGAIVTRAEVADAVVAKGGFQHGHTYAGNPMACAVGREILDIIIEENLCDNARRMGARLVAGLRDLAGRHGIIGDVRGRGLLLAIELVADRETRTPFPPSAGMNSRLTAAAAREGLIIYPRRPINGLSGDHVLVAPPLIVTADQVDEILNRLDRALAAAGGP